MLNVSGSDDFMLRVSSKTDLDYDGFRNELAMDKAKNYSQAISDQELSELFVLYDENSSGQISYKDLKDLLVMLGVDTTKESTKKLLKKYEYRSGINEKDFKTILL